MHFWVIFWRYFSSLHLLSYSNVYLQQKPNKQQSINQSITFPIKSFSVSLPYSTVLIALDNQKHEVAQICLQNLQMVRHQWVIPGILGVPLSITGELWEVILWTLDIIYSGLDNFWCDIFNWLYKQYNINIQADWNLEMFGLQSSSNQALRAGMVEIIRTGSLYQPPFL